MGLRSFIVILFVLLCSAANVFCQLQVTPNSNAMQLAQTLAGQGVTVSGAVLNCPSSANPPSNPTGTFIGTSSNIGITGGVLLTTGDINQAIGPNSSTFISTDNSVVFNDPDLIMIEPLAVNDVCILEFNVVPTCSTLAFTFAFGSDEYPEFVNTTSYNDAFGIFVTGPNPSGPAYSGYNMALIPSTAIPVAINNVHNGSTCPTTGPCVNCSHYVDNCFGTSIEYDGFTKPIKVALNVTPCASYHLKLAIADAGDHGFDSGVFFAMQSLACSSIPVVVSATSTPSSCSSNTGTASANPSGGTAPYTYTWNTAPPQNTQTATGLVPGNYTVTVKDASGCFANTASVTVAEVGGFSMQSGSTLASCGMFDGTATVTPSGGTGPYSYVWLTTPSVQLTQTAVNLIAGSYTVLVSDALGCQQSQTVLVLGEARPVADFSFYPEVVPLLDPTVNFTDGSRGVIASWHWTFGDPNSGANDTSNLQYPSHAYSDTGIFCIMLKVTNPTGFCSDSIVKCLEVEAPILFYAPNSFTPNHDGKNDIFLGYGTYIKQFQIYIFDRWGNLIFESNDINNGWNGSVDNAGKLAQEDVYVWKAKLMDMKDNEYTYRGRVTLIR